MKITICALVGPPIREKISGGPNPWIFQKKFEVELTPIIFINLIQYGYFNITDACCLKIPCNRKGDALGVFYIKKTNEIVINMEGSLMNNTKALIEKMISDGWTPVLTKEENTRSYNYDIPNLPDQIPPLVWHKKI